MWNKNQHKKAYRITSTFNGIISTTTTKKKKEEEDNSGRHKHNISSLNITKYHSASDKIAIHAGDGQSLNCSPQPPN
jgi:hypothetical protein